MSRFPCIITTVYNYKSIGEMTDMTTQKNFREFATITFGVFLVAVAVHFFMVPSKIVIGSISGLSMVLEQLTGIPLSIISLVLNAVLLVVGFIFIGKEFGGKTVYTSLLLPVILRIFEMLFPNSRSVTGNPVYDLVTYILVVALGQAILFHVNASSGGLDVIAKLLHKYCQTDIGTAVMLAGLVTSLSSILVYDLSTLVVSILGTYANGVAVDYFIDGFNKRKRVCIISDEYEDIQDYIIHDLDRGATLYVAQGAYDEKHRTELVTILEKQEYRKLLNYLNTNKKKVFITVSTVNEVLGMWNRKGR